MNNRSRSEALKNDVRRILVECARRREKITYSELGEKTGRLARGWKNTLDEIGIEEKREGRPDVAFLVVRKDTGIPGSIDFQPAFPPTDSQRATADRRFREIFEFYGND